MQRLARRPQAAPCAQKLCLPWTFDRQLLQAGLLPEDRAACNFVLFPLKELAPRLSDSVNRLLDPLARRRLAPLLGAQYVVKARRRA